MIIKDKNHLPTHLNNDLVYIKSFLNEQNYNIILMVPGPSEKKFVITEDVLFTCLKNIKDNKGL